MRTFFDQHDPDAAGGKQVNNLRLSSATEEPSASDHDPVCEDAILDAFALR
jgi:hypothetical protein